MGKVILAMAVGVVVLAAGVWADTPRDNYEKLYGADAKKVTSKDSAAFAERLAADAATLKDDPNMAAFLLDRSLDFFNRAPAGDEKTKVGATLIDQLVPAADALFNAGKYAEAVRCYQQAYQVASAVKSLRLGDIALTINAGQAKIELEKKAAALRLTLAANPNDANAARALATLDVVEFDNPTEAAHYVAVAADETLKTYVGLAVKPPADVAVPACGELADWYKGLASGASPSGRAIVYARAKTYYERFLAGYGKQDVTSLTAKKNLDEVTKDLAQLPAGARPSAATKPVAKNDVKTDPNAVWQLMPPEGYSPSNKRYYDFQKDGKLVVVGIDAGGPNDVDADGARIPRYVFIETMRCEVKDKQLAFNITNDYPGGLCLLPYPLTGDTVTGDATMKNRDSTTVSKKTFNRVPRGEMTSEMNKLLDHAKNQKKVPGTWKEEIGGGPQCGTWRFGDSGIAIRGYAFENDQRRREEYSPAKWQIVDKEIHVQAPNNASEYVLPYPLTSGAQGKRTIKYGISTSSSAPTPREYAVTFTLLPPAN